MSIADPRVFLDLPDEVQREHIEHTRCWLIGRYDPELKKPGAPSQQATANPGTLDQINQWRAQQQRDARRR